MKDGLSPQILILDRTFRSVRTLFFRLKSAADAIHANRGMNASMRGVMESLAAGPRTVPQMARARPVSRQHIQMLVDALLAEGLVETEANPAHRRSPLVALAERGRALFQEMRAEEARQLAAIGRGLRGEDLATTARTLEALIERLDALPRARS